MITSCPYCQNLFDTGGMSGLIGCPHCGGRLVLAPVVPPLSDEGKRAVPEHSPNPPCVARSNFPGDPPSFVLTNSRSTLTSGLIHGAKRDRRVTVIVVVGIALATLVFGASLAWISRPKTPSERDERWGNVLLYVDNATNRPCEVVIDGDVRATLHANTFGSLKLRSGKRRIHLRQDADIVEEDRELAANHKYLVALGRSNTYAEYRAEYRSNIFPQIPVFIISESQLQNILREAAEKLPRSVSLDAWNDVSLYDDVLYQPPKEIEIRSTNSGGASGERRVLTRLSQSDLEFLRTARADAAIGRGNMDDLRRFMERVSGHK